MIIKNATLITFDEENKIIENGCIAISDGIIKEIGNYLEIKKNFPDEEEIDANGQFVMPGNICAHTHFYGAFARGMAIPGDSPKDFPDVLNKLWWKLDKSLDKDAIYYSSLVCLIDAIKHGTTTLIDHHASPNFIYGSLDVIEQAVIESGLRAGLCYEVTDRDGEDKFHEGVEENVRFMKKTQVNQNENLFANFGLHASLSLSDKSLEICKEKIPEEFGFHIHVAEHQADQYDSLKKSKKRVVDRLDSFGILGDKTIAVHAVQVDAHEIYILAKTNTWVTHQPRSNMNNAVGMAEVESMLNAGVNVCLGNDGFSNSMWQEWKMAYLAHKLWHRDPRRMPANLIQDIAIKNNSALVKEVAGGLEIGKIALGAKADLILVDYKPITPLHCDNLPWHIVFGFQESMITSTMVNGRFIMRDRKILTLDEKHIIEEAHKVSKGVWNKYQKLFNNNY